MCFRFINYKHNYMLSTCKHQGSGGWSRGSWSRGGWGWGVGVGESWGRGVGVGEVGIGGEGG